MSNYFQGNIKLYTGPMFGGKSNNLMKDYDRFSRLHKKCILIRYKDDNRYENAITHNNNYNVKIENDTRIITHGIKLNEYKCEYLFEIDNIVSDYDIIFIDEIQFFNDCHIFCEKWANEGKIIRLAGLISTADRKLFNNVIKLIPLIENIEYCSAVSTINNKENAYFTKKIINDNNDIEKLIGGDELYIPADREAFYDIDNYIKSYTSLIEDYVKIKNKLFNKNYSINNDLLISYLSSHYKNGILNFDDCIYNCVNKS